MPILYTPVAGPGEPQNPDPGGSTSTRIQAIWSPPVGDPIMLTACPDGIDWLPGRSGEDLPPFEFVTSENVGYHGATILGVRATTRIQTLPLLLHVQGPWSDWRPLHQRFVKAMNPLAGDGILTYVMPDGTSRQLFARYSKGGEGDAISDPAGLWWRKYAIQFRADDPWWYSTTPEVVGWDVGGPAGFFPLLPVQLTSSRVIGDTTLDVAGDIESYGVWTITGPANGLATLTNVGQGRSVRLNLTGTYQLGAGQTVTVDMRPGSRSILGPTGQPWLNARVGIPQFFDLAPGLNQLTLAVAGATTATRVRFTYQPKWLAA